MKIFGDDRGRMLSFEFLLEQGKKKRKKRRRRRREWKEEIVLGVADVLHRVTTDGVANGTGPRTELAIV